MRDMTALAVDAIEKTPPPAAADPAMVTIPTVTPGAVGLLLTAVGFVQPAAGLAAMPIILASRFRRFRSPILAVYLMS